MEFRPQPFQMLPEVIKNLLIINVLLFFGTYVLEGYNIDLVSILGLHLPGSSQFKIWQPITHLFMHGSFGHLFFNMFTLFMFGTVLENIWGPKRFLSFFLISGLGAAVLHYLVVYFVEMRPELIPFDNALAKVTDQAKRLDLLAMRDQFLSKPTIVGASGGIAGILIAFAYLFPNSLLYLYFFVPIKAKYLAIFYVLYELYQAVSFNPYDNVAHFAHLGGMLAGFITVKYIYNKDKRYFY
jgi:membrane associated rhomboid family serine protease